VGLKGSVGRKHIYPNADTAKYRGEANLTDRPCDRHDHDHDVIQPTSIGQ
jgi:hypothetical protein